MRILFIFLLLFSVSASAQDKPSFFEYLKGLGKSDCEAFLDNGDALVNASNKAANNHDWDEAFYYDDQAFHTYLRAWGHCDDEPENKEKASSRLEINLTHSKQLSCLFHITESKSAYQRSTLALDHLNSASISLKHAEAAKSSLVDAENYCSFDSSRIEQVYNLRQLVAETIVILEDHITKHGEDGIEVP